MSITPDLKTAKTLKRVTLPDDTSGGTTWALWFKGGRYADVTNEKVQEWAYEAKRAGMSWTQITMGGLSKDDCKVLAAKPGTPAFQKAKVFRSSHDAMKAAAEWLKSHPELPSHLRPRAAKAAEAAAPAPAKKAAAPRKRTSTKKVAAA